MNLIKFINQIIHKKEIEKTLKIFDEIEEFYNTKNAKKKTMAYHFKLSSLFNYICLMELIFSGMLGISISFACKLTNAGIASHFLSQSTK